MKSEAINKARNPLLPAAMVAIQRAALRARQIASQTQTAIVVARDGRIEYITPHAVKEPMQGYGNGIGSAGGEGAV